MSYAIGEFEFDGPFKDLAEILDQRGVFIVVNNVFGDRKLLDVGTASQVRSAIERNPRMQLWKNRCYSGALEFGAHYRSGSGDDELQTIVDQVREQGRPVFDPPSD